MIDGFCNIIIIETLLKYIINIKFKYRVITIV